MELIAISLVAVFTLYKTVNFYFWFDDFAMFYAARLHDCPFDWPFNSYCKYMSFFYALIGDSPKPYFILALILRILMGYVFYLFLKQNFNKKSALVSSLLLVSLAGFDSIMVFYSISTSIGLGLLFLSLWLLNIFRPLSLVTFSLSTLMFPIYSTSHIFPLIFKSFRTVKKDLIYVFLALFITGISYLAIPYLQTGKLTLILERTNTKKIILKEFINQKSSDYFYTTSHFLLPEFIEWKYLTKINSLKVKTARIFIGAFLHIIILVSAFIYRRKKHFVAWVSFSLLTLITQYIPRGLVTTGGFGTHDRHMFFPYVGFAMLFMTIIFINKRLFYILGVILIFFNIYQSNFFLSKYVDINNKRNIFYKELKTELTSKMIRPNTVIFIDSPQGEASFRLGDFIRSGTLPSESSIAFSLGVNFRMIRIITESNRLSRMLSANEIIPENFYSFYFSGDKLINTTDQARQNLFGKESSLKLDINKEIKSDIFFDNKEIIWKGVSNDLEFNTNQFIGVVPFNMSLRLKAELLDYPLPYSQCIKKECTKSVKSVTEISSFIYESNQIKKDAQVDVSNLDETTYSSNLLDNIYNNRWNADRSRWFLGEKPEIEISFSKEQAITGLFLTTTTSSRKPIQIETYGNDKPINCTLIDVRSDLIKLICTPGMYKKIKLKIMKTTVEVPSIDEIDFISIGYENIDFDDIYKFKNDPFAHVISNEEKNNLNLFGRKVGTDICLEWGDVDSEVQRVSFPIFLDGLTRTYNVNLPAVGVDRRIFRLGCMNYPLKIFLEKVEISFAQ